MRKIVLSLLLIFISSPLYAQIVRKIEVTGNKRIEVEVIRETMLTHKNMPYSEENLNQDLKAIYKLGFFEDVRFHLESASDGINVLIVVKERPAIRSISYQGYSKIDLEEIEKSVDINLFSILDQKKINDSVKRIKKIYDKEGYYLVDIQPRVKSVSSEEVDLIFEISENSQVKIKRITFLGNKKFSDAKLRKSINTKVGNLFSFITKAGTYDQELLASDVQRLVYFYHDNGYLEVKVGEPQVSLSTDRESLFLSFSIVEGQAYQIGNVDITGDLIFSKNELKNVLKMKRGETFKRSVLEQDLQALNEKYSDQGYFYVNIRPIDHLDKNSHIVDINLEIEKGLKVYFERINITGNTITRDKVVRRELLVSEGELFHLSKLRKSLEAVRRLGYFEDVNPSTPRASADNQINLNLDVKEKPTGTFSIGAGFSSVDKFLFTAQISKDNFLGLGLKGDLSAQVGSKRKLYNISITDPYFMDTSWLVGISAFKSDVEFTNFTRNATGGEVQLGRPLWELFSASITYRLENVKIDNIDPAVQSFFTDGVTSSMLLGIVRDARDNRIFTKKGTYNGLFLELAGGPFGGDNEYFKVRYNSRFYYPIFKDIIFATQGTIGYIGSVTGKDVPIFERFFLGGINSLRGYRARSIGPTRQVVNLDPASGDYEFVVGGNKELVFNNEITFPIIPAVNIRGLIFFDAGNAYDDGEQIDLTDLRASYGFGLRWYSPLGPLRFEFGIPLNRKPNEDPSAFEFSIGSSF